MVTPSLRLAIIKGPREGDTLDYKPGSTIRIGRIVRGNEIAIKDAGISTKHLWIAAPVSGNWVIQDLGSSNGTLLNSNALDSETPVDLRDGDVVELGEYTSIVVNFVIDDDVPPRPRRNSKRQGNAGKRIRVSESNDIGDVSDVEKGFDVRNVNKPSSRVRKAMKIENSDGLEEEELLSEKKGNFKDVASIQSACVNSIKVEVEDFAMGEEDLGRVVKKRVDSKSTRSKNIGVVEKEETLKEKRITRSKKIDIVGDSYLELEMVLKRARKSCRKKKKKTKAEQKLLKSFECDEDNDAGVQGLRCPVGEGMNNEPGTVVDVDLGKMTLGALFSFLEGHLSKEINQETESIIEPMRSKTKRVREFISEQRRVQAKACVCVELKKVCN